MGGERLGEEEIGDKYINGSGTTPLARVLAADGSYRVRHTDGTGSTRAFTDQNGTTQAYYNYHPFGELRNQGGNQPNSNVAFIGAGYDTETGLYNLGARPYDVTLGRFTQPDPIGHAGGDNLYAYAANNPTTYADPTGTNPILALGVFAAPPVLFGMAIVASVWAYSCSHDTTCVRGVENFWDGVLASPRRIASAWASSGGMAAYGGDTFATSGGMASYSGDTFDLLSATSYRDTFAAAYPDQEPYVEDVHHAIPQWVLKRYPGRFTQEENNAIENLRGIPKGAPRIRGKSIHTRIGMEWNAFGRLNPQATRADIEWMRDKIDRKYGQYFLPQVP